MQITRPTDIGLARELDIALVIADLSGDTALTEPNSPLRASDAVLRIGPFFVLLFLATVVQIADQQENWGLITSASGH